MLRPGPEVYISQEQIEKRLSELALSITKDYQSIAGKEDVVAVCVLKGAFVFFSDIIRKINLPLHVDFIGLSSYGDATESSGNVAVKSDLSMDVAGKHVIIFEDIVDTGLTITFLIQTLKKKNPKSLKLSSLLFKPARLKEKVQIDYLGFEIEDKFVVGYGLDYAGRYRELPYVGVMSDQN